MPKNLITERFTSDSLETVNYLSRLESKAGEICLRLGDTISSQKNGRYKITRKWLRPGKEPFDQAIYGAPVPKTGA